MSTKFVSQTLRKMVDPEDWVNPIPKSRYSLVVIGGGAAGLVAAAGAASLGASVALVESRAMGGDCLHHGCVPSKSLLYSSHILKALSDAKLAQGRWCCKPAGDDFSRALGRVEEAQLRIAPNDSVARFRDLGVDVFLGAARFLQGHRVEVAERDGRKEQLNFSKALISTGAIPRMPEIPGLCECDPQTSDSIFRLDKLPTHLLIIGGGPIGCEMAQAFVRFGSKVTLVETGESVLKREDLDGAKVIADQLRSEGIVLRLKSTVTQCKKLDDGMTSVRIEDPFGSETLVVETILVAVGKIANVRDLGLENVGVTFDDSGIVVDNYLRTTNKRIFASGDVCSASKFTHSADFQSRIVLRNALFAFGPFGRRKASGLLIPRVVYTTPELAHVGLSEREAVEQGIRVNVFRKELCENDRCVIEGEETGFFKVLVQKGTNRILGATIVSPYAGEHISLWTQSIQHGIGIDQIADTMFPYPTRSDLIRRLGDEFNRTRLTPLTRKVLRWLLRWNTRN